MTTPHYSTDCAEESQERGEASSSPLVGNDDYAWYVNFNNGNVNNNHRNNDGFVRPVRVASPREYPGAVTLQDLFTAWTAARRGKKPSHNQLAFDTHWLDHLLHLQTQLNTGQWQPRPSTCFIAQRPKAREIHAPDFADRVVHHWLVPQLEALYEPTFIAHSYANRAGKGTHAAVDKLKGHIRQVHSGQGGGWFLQLDVRNFFNTIHRPTLWAMLKRRMQRHALPAHVQQATHALLRRSPLAAGVTYRATAQERAVVPPHKQLENAPPGCGLPIGNLSSQFFANVYLDALDQYIKHTLKVPRYVRYVDDFVLVHHNRDQLAHWRDQIETYLRTTLRLELKADQRLQPLSSGIDFLGFILHPTHTRVRRRVVSHAREALHHWQQQHIREGHVRTTPVALRQLNSIWASYQGHFTHANAWHLQQDFHRRFAWLQLLTRIKRRFDYRLEHRTLEIRA